MADDKTFARPSPANSRFHAFSRSRSRYRYMSGNAREQLMRAGSSSSIASISGSTQNLLDPAKVMSMQEDARSHRISAEVMKSRLYESVVTSPRKRRFSMRLDYNRMNSEAPDPQSYARLVQSLPVTPAHSQNVTPSHSPTSEKRFLFGYYSRGATPHCGTPEELEEEEEEMECGGGDDSWKGLASIFKPQPKYIPGARYSAGEAGGGGDADAMECDSDFAGGDTGLMGAPPSIMLRPILRAKKRSKSPEL